MGSGGCRWLLVVAVAAVVAAVVVCCSSFPGCLWLQWSQSSSSL